LIPEHQRLWLAIFLGSLDSFDSLVPNQLWSLWDLLKQSAREFIRLGEEISSISMNLYIADSTSRDDPDSGLTKAEKEEMRVHLIKIFDLCRLLGLNVSGNLISTRFDGSAKHGRVPETHGEWDVLMEAVKSEIFTKLFVFIPEHRAAYFDKEVTWASAFPEAAGDLKSAYRCVVASEFTAGVFHAMRTLERGLHAIVSDMKFTMPKPIESLQWANIIDQILAEIKNRRSAGKGSLDPKIEFWSGAAAQFFVFKEAWRNKTMHARVTYSESEGIKIINAVDDVMSRLATQLTEPTGTIFGLSESAVLGLQQGKSL